MKKFYCQISQQTFVKMRITAKNEAAAQKLLEKLAADYDQNLQGLLCYESDAIKITCVDCEEIELDELTQIN